MVDEKIKEHAREIERVVNGSGYLDEIGFCLARMHPTLQQQFMRIAVSFIMHVSESGMVDGRNRATWEVCNNIRLVLEDDVVTRDDYPLESKYAFAAQHI